MFKERDDAQGQLDDAKLKARNEDDAKIADYLRRHHPDLVNSTLEATNG